MELFLEEMQINLMAEKEKDQELEEVKPLSLFEKRIKDLLDELDEHLSKVGGDYGPILMKVLQNRLELIIKNFDDEVHTLTSESFKKWKVIDTQLRDLVKSDLTVLNKGEEVKDKQKDPSVPEFIKDVNFGPLKSK